MTRASGARRLNALVGVVVASSPPGGEDFSGRTGLDLLRVAAFVQKHQGVMGVMF